MIVIEMITIAKYAERMIDFLINLILVDYLIKEMA